MSTVSETLAAGLIASNLALIALMAWKFVPRPRKPAPPGAGTGGGQP